MSIKIDRPDSSNRQPKPDKIDRPETAGHRGGMPIVRVDQHLCEQSGACVLVCPEDVFASKNGSPQVVKPEACTECWICVENCVSGAIEIG